ncbi:hypothetical protein EV401DRAFT_2078485 [Pisolithus croceorrhizus]|nr:hypothetical protein EV401DRAFT_2078485 [Pisolithus croceorrhizus]
MVSIHPPGIDFQQDYGPRHACEQVTEWLEEQDLRTMVWPAQSPDLNPPKCAWFTSRGGLWNMHNPQEHTGVVGEDSSGVGQLNHPQVILDFGYVFHTVPSVVESLLRLPTGTYIELVKSLLRLLMALFYIYQLRSGYSD